MARNKYQWKYRIFSLALALQLIVPAVSSASDPAESWMVIIDELALAETYILRSTEDGGHIIAITYFSEDEYDDRSEHFIKIMKVDAIGEIERENVCAFPGSIRAVMAPERGGYLFAGTGKSGETDRLILLRTDDDCNKLWERREKLDVNVYERNALHFAEAGEGGSVAVIERRFYAEGEPDNGYRVIRFDASGGIVWDRIFSGEREAGFIWGQTDLEPRVVAQTSDGGFIVAGTFFAFGTGWILKLDSQGRELWFKRLEGRKATVHEILPDEKGGAIIAGEIMKHFPGNLSSNIWVAKLDKDGNILSEKTCGPTFQRRRFVTNDISRTSDGGYVLAGGIVGGPVFLNMNILGLMYVYKNSVWIIKLDQDLEEEWSKKLKIDGGLAANNVSQAKDGGYLVAGRYRTPGMFEGHPEEGIKNVAWMIKLDKDGRFSDRTYYEEKLKASAHSIIRPFGVAVYPLYLVIKIVKYAVEEDLQP